MTSLSPPRARTFSRFFNQFRSRQAPARKPSSRPGHRLRLEALEDRCVPSTLTVISAADDGSAGTLRAVIAAASPSSVIAFDHRLQGKTITLTKGQLELNKSLDIEGPGA